MNKYNYSYKKNKLEQLKGFCTLVESGTVTKAASILHTSISTISLQISSLERDLKVRLFDRVDGKLKLNSIGKIYYLKAKNALREIEDIYDCKLLIRVSKIQKLKLKTINMFNALCKIILKHLRKSFLTLTLRGLFATLIAASVFIMIYMKEVNYLFDKEIEKAANPLLKEIIQKDYYRIDKNTFCPFEPTQFHLDINSLLLELIKKKYDIGVSCLTVNEHPGTPMRMSGEDDVDSVFNNTDAIKCDTARRYDSLKTRHKQKTEMMNISKNVHLYNFYQNENGRNHNIFLDNVKKYQGQLLGIKVNLDSFPLNTGKYWIIKHGSYYYLFLESNGIQSQHQNKMQERYLIYKKLTLDQLRQYDSGSYWSVIKKYNISI